jgi:hypothetical protein
MNSRYGLTLMMRNSSEIFYARGGHLSFHTASVKTRMLLGYPYVSSHQLRTCHRISSGRLSAKTGREQSQQNSLPTR